MADTAPVPERYRGVWVRTLLRAPTLRDDRTWVRWLQTARWHGDLRVPASGELALQQGFSGLTTVDEAGGGEICAWHRQVDFQPPRPDPDAGHVVFDGPDRLVETGVHADYMEVWERLPGSSGRLAVLETDDDPPCRLLLAGEWLMRVRARSAPWPADSSTADTLADLLRRHPAQAAALLDFEISFGRLVGGRWAIEQSTVAALRGSEQTCTLHRVADDAAELRLGLSTSRWHVLEWNEGAP